MTDLRVSNIQIGKGHVYHSRKVQAAHSFRYPTFHLFFRVDQEPELQKILRSRFWNLLSISSSSYLDNGSGALDFQIRQFLKQTCQYEAEEVWLQTLPRMFGFAFNPISFWFCRRAGKLEAVLAEVNNTFGERHFYWIQPGCEISSQKWFRSEKVFHVSPFFPVEGFYQFRFHLDSSATRIDINYNATDGSLRLATSVDGHLSPIASESLFSIVGCYGWMSVMVVLRIHYQAIRLWIKKCQFHSKPALPQKKVSS